VIVDEVCRYLGVGLGYEFVALCLELVLDLLVVLDDPVVNDRMSSSSATLPTVLRNPID
jgi:hypothetical protein